MEVKVQTAELTLTTVKLSMKILRQLPRICQGDLVQLLKDENNVVGWIHGSVFEKETGSGMARVILRTGENTYGFTELMDSTIKSRGWRQIFVA